MNHAKLRALVGLARRSLDSASTTVNSYSLRLPDAEVPVVEAHLDAAFDALSKARAELKSGAA